MSIMPRDEAGNPLDPMFQDVVFTGGIPQMQRSVFTDRGPIARPPLTVQSGSGGTINSPDTITLTGANLNTSSHLGLTLTLTGSSLNNGTFRIGAVLSATKVRLNANFHLPDASNGSLSWTVLDPRDGQIADEPGDVTVTVNGVSVTPDAVVGLLGQVVLPDAPAPGDDVKVNYRWIDNPTVEIRRLNSREFQLNGWNQNVGFKSRSRHSYRFNNVLLRPSDYRAANILAKLDQPIERDLKYRAYERAYTPVLNDPTSLRLNSPLHRIALSQLSRTVEPTFVSYTGVVLPEDDVTAPWKRHHLTSGAASIHTGGILRVQDTSTGPYPTGEVLLWSRNIDLMFEHVFAATWRMRVVVSPTSDGVFTGVAAGYSDNQRAIIVGYLNDGGVKKIGFLKAGAGNDPSSISGWAGGFDSQGNPTGQPFAFDWSETHSYRLARDRNSNVKLFIDGDVTEVLRLAETSMPYLSELDTPFNHIEGVFFGSLSRPAINTSEWEFFRYNILPINPLQISPSIFVSYEGIPTPETASPPWTPIGFAGTESIINGTTLLLDATSAIDESELFVGGDFKGFVRLEPLLAASSDTVLDFEVQLRTHTHGISPNALIAAVDDGDRLMQLSFLADAAAPKFSYGGHAPPELFSPTPWETLGGQLYAMVGRYLKITDSSTTDGRIFYVTDTAPSDSVSRVVSSATDYILESRVRVLTYVSDASGFCGVTAEVYDGLRSVGFDLHEISGVRHIGLHSDGVLVTQFAFEWFDSQPHTYRLVKSTAGNTVSLFVDSIFVGAVAYSAFGAPSAGPDGVLTFGSSTAASVQARSTAEWTYMNVWRVLPSIKRYVGLWKGVNGDSLIGYHLPLKTLGSTGTLNGNTLVDTSANFVTANVSTGDYILIDVGSNQGAYTITSVTQTALTVAGVFPSTPSIVGYRIPTETDWSVSHQYRMMRDPGGVLSIYLDYTQTPIMSVEYSSSNLPQSAAGILRTLSGALPSVAFGAFEPSELSQSAWNFVRYGITRASNENRIAPHHPFLNQRNVIASPEHLFTQTAHTHTDFWSRSTGIPPQIEPDFLRDPDLVAYTILNDRTPLVPQTQTFEVRRPQVIQQSASGLNRPEDVLNSDGDFVLNDGELRLVMVVPNDVLYNSLSVIETTVGTPDLLAPFDDRLGLGSLQFQKKLCLTYHGTVVPEQDLSAPTPWVIESDDSSRVNVSVYGGVLTYGTNAAGTRTIYKNRTPLTDMLGMSTEVKFRLKLLSDASAGLGDTQVRFGFSAPGLTLSIGFVTTPLGERYVLAIDQKTQAVLGGQLFDFFDGNFHTYRLVREPGVDAVRIFIDR